ncbi:hypothetical protein CRM22_007273 [Opisthorchis felineus]|uniref:Armadillo repeat-containing domain-containing protein n=1 Tax=Opisthorchis felineus TaxID=147828 RepID=A0A4S2LH34_OPIFE|nr:hypothetical protein CRM22_007273 [Opisthorchis felineus]
MASAKQDSATYNMTCLLREWDRAPKEKRRQFLQDFIDQHHNRSGPELESELAQMASLFLARICVWIKLTYMSGTCLTEQLQALHIFLAASSSHSFLLEFLEHGGVLCLQELCLSPNGKEVDKRWALKVLSCVANAGTRYKETICECYGIRAVAECMAKSTSEETQEEARSLLQILAEGNPRFSDQVYKGLIGVLPCHSPKAQQLALQTIRVLQQSRETANRALIDRIIYLLESLHLEVQSAVIELVRDLMRFDLADDILVALVTLLRPQREIQLGKLFTEAVSGSDSSSDMSESEYGDDSDVASALSQIEVSKSSKPRKIGVVRKPKLVLTEEKSTVARHHAMSDFRTRSTTSVQSLTSGLRDTSTRPGGAKQKTKTLKKRGDSQSEAQPLPAFVQQASAAKCIRILAQDSRELTKKILKLGALSSLLYAMGNLEFSDSQRQASLTLEYLCQTYPVIDLVVRDAMGPSMHDEFTNSPDAYFHQMTPLQADVLVSNKVTYLGEGI